MGLPDVITGKDPMLENDADPIIETIIKNLHLTERRKTKNNVKNPKKKGLKGFFK